MPDATISRSDPIPDPDNLPTPPEEEFWEKYNKRLEFPLSTVSAVLIHVLVAATLIFVLVRLMKDDDRSSVPLTLVEGGMDDAGDGSPGSGREQDPLYQSDKNAFAEQLKALPNPDALPAIKENLKKILLDDTGDTPIADNNAAAYGAVSDDLAKKLLGAKKGSGGSAGSGDDGSKGTGPGGAGASSTRARSLRWVMRFRTADGEDYVNQLAAMGAVVLVPLPPENKQCLYFPDLKNPSNRRLATDVEVSKMVAGQIKFGDTRPDSVRAVCGILGVREPARSFWAFFPKGLEEQLAQKEIGYRNRRPEDIEETVFRVIVRGGGYEIIVDDQQAKR